MKIGIAIILSIVLIIGFILLMRLIGAWMLRIDEVIRLLRDIRNLLKHSSDKQAVHTGDPDEEIRRKAALYDKQSISK